MEQLLHYIWKHKLFSMATLQTIQGEKTEVIDPGLSNSDAGPDFFNAKIKINDTLWVGNVEIHERSSDWYRHGHDKDKSYDNVILHVIKEVDCRVFRTTGEPISQLVLNYNKTLSSKYSNLCCNMEYPPCYSIISSLSSLKVHSYLSSLLCERLSNRSQQIARRLRLYNNNWEDSFFCTLARNFGFGINGDAFEQWAQSIDLRTVDKHRDNLFQVEAIFLGQAGLLDIETIPEYYRKEAMEEGYFQKLRTEYLYLSHKFNLKPIDVNLWKFLRMRPNNFPHIRLAELASLYHHQQVNLSRAFEAETTVSLRNLLSARPSEYWEKHVIFGSTSLNGNRKISDKSLDLLIINTVVPFLFAYGKHKGDESACERAERFLEEIKAEDNYIIRLWNHCGITVNSAADSQALIQLKKEYCDKKGCLRCRIGYEYLRIN